MKSKFKNGSQERVSQEDQWGYPYSHDVFYLSDDIGRDAQDPQDIFIRDNFLVKDGTRFLFSCQKFNTKIDELSDEELSTFLKCMDDYDIYLQRVYWEASVPLADLSEEDTKFALLIDDRDLVTFEDFLSY
jgi:hypothetical protein